MSIYSIVKSYSQDPSFSNVFNASPYYHPSFTTLQKGVELNAIYRNHWPKIPNLYETEYVGVNGQFTFPALKHWNFGSGLSIMKDQEGVGNLVTLNPKLTVRFKWLLTYKGDEGCISQESSFTLGFYGGYSSKKVNYSGLVFSDQLQMNGQVAPSTVNYSNFSNKSTDGDLGASLTYFNNKKIFDNYFVLLNLSAHHLENYDEASFIDNTERLPAFWIGTVNAGNLLNEKKEKDIKFLYRFLVQVEKQTSLYRISLGTFTGLIIKRAKINRPGIVSGVEFNYHFRSFEPYNTNAFALGLMFKYHIKEVILKFGFTADLVTTGLAGHTGSSNEYFINLKYDHCEGNSSCPSF